MMWVVCCIKYYDFCFSVSKCWVGCESGRVFFRKKPEDDLVYHCYWKETIISDV